MAIKDFINKFLHKDNAFKEMQNEDRLRNKLETRKKNSNERELERFEEEDRQKMIKERLEQFRNRQKEEFFHGPNLMKQKNIFQGHQSVMTNNKKLFSVKNNNLHGQGMFFK